MKHTPIPGIHDVIRMTDVIPESDDPVIRHARSVLNKSLFGSLTVEFDARQVVLSNIRGDVAMRFHAIVADHREGDPSSARWADQHDPRYSTADARLVTFEVSRIMSVLWEPERLVHGDGARRELVSACIRIIQTSAKYKDHGDWEFQDFADYGQVSLDMLPTDSADDVGAEVESDDADADADADGDTEPDPDDSGGNAEAAPVANEEPSDRDDGLAAANEVPEGGGANA